MNLSDCAYNVAHWLFAFRYFEVAEMLGRAERTIEQHFEVRKITSKISYVGIAVIIIDYLACFGDYMWNRA
jgi:hypothetical protein